VSTVLTAVFPSVCKAIQIDLVCQHLLSELSYQQLPSNYPSLTHIFPYAKTSPTQRSCPCLSSPLVHMKGETFEYPLENWTWPFIDQASGCLRDISSVHYRPEHLQMSIRYLFFSTPKGKYWDSIMKKSRLYPYTSLYFFLSVSPALRNHIVCTVHNNDSNLWAL
jgi:hypothetical protein